jgi:hypothetical protein
MKPPLDRFVEVLEEFFVRYNYGKVTLKEDDPHLIAAWLCEIPPGYEFLRDQYAYNFAAALDCCRRNRRQWAS